MIDLHALMPEFEAAVEQLLADLRVRVGIDYRPYLGYRTAQEQQVLWDKHNAGGPRAAPPWASPHQWGLAVDVEAFTPGPDWSDGAYVPLAQALADHPTLRSGASFRDADHIEWRHPAGPWTADRLAGLPRIGQSELQTRAWPLVRIVCGTVQADGSKG